MNTKAYNKIYRAVFDFHAKYKPFPATPAAWEAAADDMNAISNAHDNNPFVMDMLCAVWAELERTEQRLKQQAAG